MAVGVACNPRLGSASDNQRRRSRQHSDRPGGGYPRGGPHGRPQRGQSAGRGSSRRSASVFGRLPCFRPHGPAALLAPPRGRGVTSSG
eukprot:5317755-Lingulodinium_polyedra.AAC.1